MQRNKILKETKIIPRVVYEIEQFHKEILSLDKKTGVSITFKEKFMYYSYNRFILAKANYLGSA